MLEQNNLIFLIWWRRISKRIWEFGLMKNNILRNVGFPSEVRHLQPMCEVEYPKNILLRPKLKFNRIIKSQSRKTRTPKALKKLVIKLVVVQLKERCRGWERKRMWWRRWRRWRRTEDDWRCSNRLLLQWRVWHS